MGACQDLFNHIHNSDFSAENIVMHRVKIHIYKYVDLISLLAISLQDSDIIPQLKTLTGVAK